MKTKKISNLSIIWVMLFLIQGCTNELPEIASLNKAQDEETSISNMLENEIVKVAMNGYSRFYGGLNGKSRGFNAESCITPLNIVPVKRHTSRNSDASPVLYVVNFTDNNGFAVVSTARLGEKLLAVSDAGYYDNTLISDIPGLDLWMNNAVAYAEYQEKISQDSLFKPLFPTDPIDGRLQYKEWNDTTSHTYISPQLHVAWGQGSGNDSKIDFINCEGRYFSNGICGCGALAIAQICTGLKYPDYLYETYPGVGKIYTFDWDDITKHKTTFSPVKNEEYKETGSCYESNRVETHESVARLCRIIGNYGHATSDGNKTGMTSSNLLGAANLVFGYDNVSHPWQKLSISTHFPKGTFAIVTGDSKYAEASAHAWVCDGVEHIYFTHYLATRKGEIYPWEIQSSVNSESHYLHFNWGWDSSGNGWYYTIEPDVRYVMQRGYTNLCYVSVRH